MTWHPDSKTTLYGIIGHPVGHSLSPDIHNSAFRAQGLNSVYLAFDVTELGQAMAGVRGLNIKGLSVTIPHKEEIMAFLDEIDPKARRIGAVNTVINRDGRLFGTNTDCIGAVRALEDVTDVSGKRVLVLGAGGSSRAVCVGLHERGARVHIANRTPEKAEELASICDGTWSGLDSLEKIDASILVNTTSVGMAPDADKTLVSKELLNRFEAVMDIVYAPVMTRLLKEAEEAGCKIITGLRMLLYQAIAQYELWSGKEAPVSVMEQVIRKRFEKG